ncbi:MAG: asparaginase [Candidatus Aenigmarchaeota archaeon]|nr:asparaginase [Candidatus Aenigmarchaeota archaeon]
MKDKVNVFVLNSGGTIGSIGKPLRPAKSAAELVEGVVVPKEVNLTLADFKYLLDSTDIMHSERLMMARQIASVYKNHDAFVLLHGTDSLAETAAAFCMFFKSTLQKPLIIIGAQMAKDEPGSEAIFQLSNAFRVAAAFHRNNVVGVYNVCIGDVWDGSRVRKRSESNFNAFYTPGRYPVAKIWPSIHFDEGLKYKDPVLAVQDIRIDAALEKNVATLKVSADTPPWIAMDLIKNNRIKGLILECKGIGGIPQREWYDSKYGTTYSWIDVIGAATEAGVHIGVLSPFDDGRVILGRYELGQLAKEAGAISLESLTPDMADVKFRQAIALFPEDRDRIQKFISTNIIGELLTGKEDTGSEE